MLTGNQLKNALTGDKEKNLPPKPITEAIVLSSRVVLIDFGESIDVVDRPFLKTVPVRLSSSEKKTVPTSTSTPAPTKVAVKPVAAMSVPIVAPSTPVASDTTSSSLGLCVEKKLAGSSSAGAGDTSSPSKLRINWLLDYDDVYPTIGVGGRAEYQPGEARQNKATHELNYEKTDIYSLGITLLEIATVTKARLKSKHHLNAPQDMVRLLNESKAFPEALVSLLSLMTRSKFSERIDPVTAYHVIVNLCSTCGNHVHSPPTIPSSSSSAN
jgi:hypothetical protein